MERFIFVIFLEQTTKIIEMFNCIFLNRIPYQPGEFFRSGLPGLPEASALKCDRSSLKSIYGNLDSAASICLSIFSAKLRFRDSSPELSL
jgi:hypothetical protein